jgi:hypothetical protein
MPRFTALSIVAPYGLNVANGRKTLEVCSWQPNLLPLKNLLIVENDRFLFKEGDCDVNGSAVALVDVRTARAWLPSEVEAACSKGWAPCHFAWQLENVRPLREGTTVMAARKLYEVDAEVLFL